MNLFIFTDESGVFDYINNDYFVFGGIIFLCKNEKNRAFRKYQNVEKSVRQRGNYSGEIKASTVLNKHKYSLFTSINDGYKFGVVVDQKQLIQSIFNNKKSKQRYLDYAYKIGLKRALCDLDAKNIISLAAIENMYIQCDEHTTATDGRYELKEGLLEEFKNGTHNYKWSIYYKPICPQVKSIDLRFTDSNHGTGIRIADVIANKIYFNARRQTLTHLQDKVFITELP